LTAPSVAAEQKARPFTSAGRARVHQWARFTVGSAGAVTLDTDFSDPGITLGNFTAGVAALSYPASPKALIRMTIQPNAVTDDNKIQVTAQSSTAGTATVKVDVGGVATSPASGAVIYAEIIGERHK